MKKAIAFVLVLALLTSVGSIGLVRATPYIVILTVCVVSILVALGKIDAKCIPMYVFGLALARLWQTSMLGVNVVGVDIHNELSIVRHSIENGWVVHWANGNNSSLVLGGLAPVLAKYLGLSPTWQFKALYPAIYACTPVLLYCIYKRMIGSRYAYLAVLFIVVMPMFSMEMTSMVKSLVAQTLLALAVWILVCSKAGKKYKVAGMTVALGIAIASHYTIGLMIVIYFVGALAVLIALKRWLKPNTLSLRGFSTVTLAVVLVCFGYYSWFGGGFMFNTFVATGQSIAQTSTAMMSGDSAPQGYLDRTRPSESTQENTQPNESTQTKESKRPMYLSLQEPLVRTALGLDFGEASAYGKAFRVLQYLTELLLVVGLFCMFRRKYEISGEYKALVIASFGVLASCLFVPFFSTTVSVTRFYMVALTFIAPLLVLGIEGIYDLVAKVRV